MGNTEIKGFTKEKSLFGFGLSMGVKSSLLFKATEFH